MKKHLKHLLELLIVIGCSATYFYSLCILFLEVYKAYSPVLFFFYFLFTVPYTIVYLSTVDEYLRYQKTKEKIFKLLDKLDKFTVLEVYKKFSNEMSLGDVRECVFEYYNLHKDKMDYYIDKNKGQYVFVKVKRGEKR